MDSNNAVISSQLSEQMNTAVPNEILTSVSADTGRPTDIPEVPNADQTATPSQDTTPGKEVVTAMPDPLGLPELWSGGKVQDPGSPGPTGWLTTLIANSVCCSQRFLGTIWSMYYDIYNYNQTSAIERRKRHI